MHDVPDADVIVVGAGISGLTAARALVADGLRVTVLEQTARCGGVIHTDRTDGFVIDTGPDTLLAHKPAALTLVRDAGLSDRLVTPLPDRRTYVVRDGRLRTLPQTSALGLPTDLRTLVTAGAFSWRGKLRMAAEPLIAPRTAPEDESIASFVQRRFGREAVTAVAEPVLAGLHRGEAAALSVQALFPTLANAERTRGSVARYWRTAASRPPAGPMSLRGGLDELVSRLEEQLPCGVVRTGAAVASLEHRRGFIVSLRDGTSLSCVALLLATPAYAAAPLVRPLDGELGRLCGTIRHAAAVGVALGYRREDVRHPLHGWGCVSTRATRGLVRSVSWVSSKWPGRAPDGHVLLRAALGTAGEPVLDQPDDALITRAQDDLARVLSVRGAPVLERVYRREHAMPQLEVGHLARMQAIDRRLDAIPGVFVSASGFRGVGLPDCIADAQRVAGRVAEYTRAHVPHARREGRAC